MVNQQPKILLYDLETAPRLAYVWGEYEQNVLWVVKESYILCFSYRWFGDTDTKVITLKDFNLYSRDKENDLQVVKRLHNLQEEADIVIGHNADKFDNKWANKQFIFHGLPPVSPYKSVDTLKIAKKHFNFPSNSLDSLGEFLGLGRKVKHEGKELWRKVMANDPKAWKKMIRYARQDVVLLGEVYNVFRPWIDNHPNIALYNEDRIACPKCGSKNVIRRGFDYTRVGKYQAWKCKDCLGWSRSRVSEEVELELK